MKTFNIPHNWAGTGVDREMYLSDSCRFEIGDPVRVTGNLPGIMSHFGSEGKSAVVIKRDLTTDYGICDYGYYPIYVIHIDGEGASAWYPEDTLEDR
jgi:hypothetical protein